MNQIHISNKELPEAILLLGPTGSGKTPLGETLERAGLGGRRCFHFDFGSRLRRYTGEPTGLLTSGELEVVRGSLLTGALLEDEHFSIAEKLLAGFIRESNPGPNDLIVMNGLPRHTGQALALEGMIDMKALVVLECTPETVLERIRSDAGGDRTGRVDDTIEEVKRRLKVFAERTQPLTAYYERRGTPSICLDIGSSTTAEEALKTLAGRLSGL
ncbi:nucleoside monophosphate kinase [Dehalogenimonas sp. THU2]|uniref:nucleoside monophosphate kinase n=1 Tax=Dehalogenimonas sp. THU2 TaxID=3151121 RepID=UPI003218B74D